MKRHPLLVLVFACTLWTGASVLSAQEDEDIIELDPFEVNAEDDVGYYAANAFSAYRINIRIRDIPFNIQVVSEELIDDLRAIDLEDIAPYVSGVGLQVENNNTFERGAFTVRGLNISRPKRNGFTRYLVQDTTNIERVEVVKGPASAMYGAAEPGGIINYVTKKPTPELSGDLQLTVGTWDYYRAQVGVSGPTASEDLLFRVDASYLDREGYRDWEWEERSFFSGVLEWTPKPGTLIRGDIEYTKREFNPVSRNLVWNPEAYARWVALSDEERFANSTLRSVPQTEDGIRLWTEVAPHFPLTINAAGPDAYADVEGLVGTVEGRTTLTDWLSFRGVASYGEVTQDTLIASANRLRVTGDGVSRSHRSLDSTNTTFNVQGDFLADFDLGGMRHRVLAGFEYNEDEFESENFRDSPPSQLLYFSPGSVGILPEGADILDYRLDPQDRFTGAGYNQEETFGLYTSWQASALDQRLHVLAGLRHDINNAYDRDDNKTRPEITETSPQIGVNFEVLPWLILYGNYSQSFLPQGGSFRTLPPGGEREDDVIQLPRDPQIGEGFDFGVKLESGDGRFSGTISFFSIERQNVVAPLVLFPDGPSVPETSFRIDRYIAGEESEGFEVNLLLAPVAGLQVIVNYAYIDAVRIDEESEGTFYEDFQRMVPGVPENQFSVWTKYKFQGMLEGAAIGGGFIYQGERRGGLTRDDFIILDDFNRVDLFAEYGFTVWERDASVRLNVQNLFDETYFRPGPIVENPTNAKLTFTIDL